MQVQVVDHPIAAARLTVLRDERTDPAGFRAALRDLSGFLVYEATRGLAVEKIQVTTPMGPATGTRVAASPLLVPVLRAGLGMVDAALALLPEARTGFVGVARDEATWKPISYMEVLPHDLTGETVLLLDPMLATGGSALHALRLLAARVATQVTVLSVLAAPEGIAALRASQLPVRVVTAAVDERLNEFAFIIPGLGDAGDRQFGPR